MPLSQKRMDRKSIRYLGGYVHTDSFDLTSPTAIDRYSMCIGVISTGAGLGKVSLLLYTYWGVQGCCCRGSQLWANQWRMLQEGCSLLLWFGASTRLWASEQRSSPTTMCCANWGFPSRPIPLVFHSDSMHRSPEPCTLMFVLLQMVKLKALSSYLFQKWPTLFVHPIATSLMVHLWSLTSCFAEGKIDTSWFTKKPIPS